MYKEGFMLHDQAEAHCLANQWKCWGVPPMKDLRYVITSAQSPILVIGIFCVYVVELIQNTMFK